MGERRNDLEIVIEILQIASQIPNSDRSPLYDVRNPARASCEGHACEVMFSRTNLLGRWSARLRSSSYDAAAYRYDRACPAIAGVASEGWWSQTGSNRPPHASKARALPAELCPRTRRRMLAGLPSPTSPPPASPR